MSAGEKIREILNKKNLTQKWLSIETKIAPPKLNLVITGKRNLKVPELEVICWALGCEPSNLVTPHPPTKKGV